ncbi:MAG: metallophosphoesterase family protein [Archangium sp.]|nr:metallophosphoesterase family protein [Archangium sp.]
MAYTSNSRVRTAEAVIPLHVDGSLRVGIVADTHSEPHLGGLAHLTALKPDVILHAGDIGDLGVITKLKDVAPVHAVRGNIDSRVDLPDVMTLEFKQGEQRALMVMLTHIAVAGPVIRADAAKRARAAKASLIVCGHSHVPFITQDRGLTLFNPGSIGPRRFRLPILFGVMQISATGVSLKHIDAETGREWRPT